MAEDLEGMYHDFLLGNLYSSASQFHTRTGTSGAEARPSMHQEIARRLLEGLGAKDISLFVQACGRALQAGRDFYAQRGRIEELLCQALQDAGREAVEKALEWGLVSRQVEEVRGAVASEVLGLGLISVGYLTEMLRDLFLLATTDWLTGLPDRQRFLKELDTALEGAKSTGSPLSLLRCEVDNLALINDLYGYESGDAVLRSVADVIRDIFCSQDALIARVEGDAFAVLLRNATAHEAVPAAERLRQAVENVRVPYDNIGVTLSIGISSYPSTATASGDLLAGAEMACRKAKKLGKNRVVALTEAGEPNEFTSCYEKILMLHEALSRPDGIVPYFQPIVNMNDQKVLGYELLARVNQMGRVLPAFSFIEVAEDVNLMHRVTMRALARALELLSLGRNHNDCYLFVNCSVREAESGEFVRDLKRLLKANKAFAPENLVVELTERQALQNVAGLRGFIDELHKVGASVFGKWEVHNSATKKCIGSTTAPRVPPPPPMGGGGLVFRKFCSGFCVGRLKRG